VSLSKWERFGLQLHEHFSYFHKVYADVRKSMHAYHLLGRIDETLRYGHFMVKLIELLLDIYDDMEAELQLAVFSKGMLNDLCVQ
jgi:hypothetical protein